MIDTLQGYLETGRQTALDWITSPAAYAQFGLLVVAYLLAVVANAWLRPKLARVLEPADSDTRGFAKARRFVLMFLPILLPLLAYAFTAAGEQVTRSLFGSGAVIAFGKRVFIFLAVRRIVNEIISDPFLKLLGTYIAIPLAAIYAIGLLTPLSIFLEETELGSVISISPFWPYSARRWRVRCCFGWVAGHPILGPTTSGRRNKSVHPLENLLPRRSS